MMLYIINIMLMTQRSMCAKSKGCHFHLQSSKLVKIHKLLFPVILSSIDLCGNLSLKWGLRPLFTHTRRYPEMRR